MAYQNQQQQKGGDIPKYDEYHFHSSTLKGDDCENQETDDDEWSDSIKNWTKDVQALIQSEELRKVASSTTKLLSLATRQIPNVAVHMITMPIQLPRHIIGSIWDVSSKSMYDCMGALQTCMVHPFMVIQSLEDHQETWIKEGEEEEQEEVKEEQKETQEGICVNSTSTSATITNTTTHRMPHEHALHSATSLFLHVKDDIAPMILDTIGIRSLLLTSSQTSQVSMIDRVESDVSYETCTSNFDSSSSSNSYDDEIDENENCHHHDHHSIDEEITSKCTWKDCDWIQVLDLDTSSSKIMNLDSLKTNAIMDEFMTSMASAALSLSSDDIQFVPIQEEIHPNSTNVWVDWKPIGSSANFITRNQGQWSTPAVLNQMEQEVLLWSGKMKDSKAYGSNIPLFKARGIVSHMSPSQLMEVFYDSTKCQTYNRYSNGRRDVEILKHNDLGRAKIVENETKIPFCGKSIQMRMMMIVKPLNDDGFIIVTKSIESKMSHVQDNNNGVLKSSKLGERDEILWSINVLRGLKDPGHTDLTLVTQANSNMIPSFLAEKVGIMCTFDFFKRLRQVENM